MSFRVGLGQDSHRFLPEFDLNKPLILGGYTLAEKLSFDAQSDGDVILHALFNGISQALGLRSIGYYCDQMCLEKGITDSREYLKYILEKMRHKNYNIGNIGLSIEAKTPRLEAYIPDIQASLATLCYIDISQIGITATSGEELSAFGQGLGLQVLCIVNLNQTANS